MNSLRNGTGIYFEETGNVFCVTGIYWSSSGILSFQVKPHNRGHGREVPDSNIWPFDRNPSRFRAPSLVRPIAKDVDQPAPVQVGRAPHEKSQPRNGAVEIFAAVAAEIRRASVSTVNRVARDTKKARQIGKK